MSPLPDKKKGNSVIPEETFSARLKIARKNKGLNQKELASLMGVHIGTVSHWENGKQIPDSNTIQKLAATLEINISYLLGEDNPLSIDIKSKEPEIDELVEKLKALSNASLQIIGPAILAAYNRDEEDGTLKKKECARI